MSRHWYEPGEVRWILQEINEELQPLVELIFDPQHNSDWISTMSWCLTIKINSSYYGETETMGNDYIVETAKTIQKVYRWLKWYILPAEGCPTDVSSTMYFDWSKRQRPTIEWYEDVKIQSLWVPMPNKKGLYMFTPKDYNLYFMPF